ncbi:MAG: acyltransferase family protein [Gemmatimonadales bacterium]
MYRPDIDGLRAVAVLAVVGFHAEIGALRGGFAGVDVFFVISGYLISGIIFSALHKGTFTFAEFYTRRINRIFPALIVMAVTVVILGALVLFPPEFIQLGKHVLGSSTFVSNLMLWKETGYFDSADKPLLHLWSLAVEEQFYLMWPLVLVVAWRRKWNVTLTAGAIIAASFIWNIWAVSHYAGTAAFYLPVTRFWEILSGAILCWREMGTRATTGEAKVAGWPSHVLSICGLVLILLSITLVDASTVWPGWFALLPVLGTVLVIIAGKGALVNRRILSSKALVAMGLISYPLYLWHWPLLVIARLVNEGQLTRFGRLAVIALSTVLAALTFVMVERPIRFGSHKRRSSQLLLAGMAIFAFVGLSIQRQVVRPRLARTYDSILKPTDSTIGPGAYFNEAGIAFGSTLEGDPQRTVVFIGDSHGAMYRPRIEFLARAMQGRFPKVVFLTFGGCPPFPGVNRHGISWDGAPWRCDQLHRAIMARVMRPDVKRVVIAAFWEGYVTVFPLHFSADRSGAPIELHSAAFDSVLGIFGRELRDMRRSGKDVYLVLSNPSSHWNNPASMLPRRLAWLEKKEIVRSVLRADGDPRAMELRERLRALATKEGVTVIDPMDSLCDQVTCPTVDSAGRPVYRDDHHFRPSFVRNYVTFLDTVVTSR